MTELKDLKYSRPDVRGILDVLETCADEAETAENFREFSELLADAETAMRSLSDADTLSNLRMFQDREDAFYRDENNFILNEKLKAEKSLDKIWKAAAGASYRESVGNEISKARLSEAEAKLAGSNAEFAELQARENELKDRYNRIGAGLEIVYEGENRSMPQMSKYLDSDSPEVRRAANAALGKALSAKADELDDIFDKLVTLRDRQARLLGYENYVELGYILRGRTSYTKDDVRRFREQVKKYIVPLTVEFHKRLAVSLGSENYKFWDKSIYCVGGNPSLKEDADAKADTLRLLKSLDGELSAMISRMEEAGSYDLFDNGKKITAGFAAYLYEQKLPIVYTSSFGRTVDDVFTLVHESGHAYNFYLNGQKPWSALLHLTSEIAETHSTALELLFWPCLESLYGENKDKAKKWHIWYNLNMMPYECLIDEFQHEVYENPSLTKVERNSLFLKLEKEYMPDMHYNDLPYFSTGRRWQRAMHVYNFPFYFIDYALAQYSALQIWQVLQNNGQEEAWRRYRLFIENSGRLSFTEILEKADLDSPFEENSVTVIAEAVKRALKDISLAEEI